MNLPVIPFGTSTMAGLVDWLRTLATSIATGWGVEHQSDGTHGDVSVTGLAWGGDTATTVGAAGSASALPANPTGYLVITIEGTDVKVPYYTA